MFYSQFILAKKGPLGTIWIAAHLERKLRKNQVADTDIGVSVDSIIFPEVPIALRLSSHLLLGVVRIYSRKVNYLFDDCSEALLKIKQAFRSTAVDLPPEESTAPYHSITLPETFDLDDFELPENEMFQGNYVDHHVSAREQITLQDTMEGVVYSTSQFGPDERFGDGGTCEINLDLDEEAFLQKVEETMHGELSNDAHTSTHRITPKEEDENELERTDVLKSVLDNNNDNRVESMTANSELLEYAEAPATPGLVGEANLSSVKEALISDDHLAESLANEAMHAEEMNRIRANGEGTSRPFMNEHLLANGDDSASLPLENLSEPVKSSYLQGKSPYGLVEILDTTEPAKNADGLIESDIYLDNQTAVKYTENLETAFVPAESSSDTALKYANLENGASDELRDRPISHVHVDNVMQEDNNGKLDVSHDGMEKDLRVANGVQQVFDDNHMAEPLFSKNMDDAPFPNGKLNNAQDLPPTETLLSVVGEATGEPNKLLEDLTPEKKVIEDESGNAKITNTTGKKRSLTESTLTEESSGRSFSKRTLESVPDDDDLLSSILVGKRSSVLKLKPSPAPSEVIFSKRRRITHRVAAHKRKVLVDDTMVLHGDAIRQQLTNTEDLRRVRKKAPCTLPEISVIQRQFLGDEIFSEPILTGFSLELHNLHKEAYDLSHTSVFEPAQGITLAGPAVGIDPSHNPTMICNTEIEASYETQFIGDELEPKLLETIMCSEKQGDDLGLASLTDIPEELKSQQEPVDNITEMELDREKVDGIVQNHCTVSGFDRQTLAGIVHEDAESMAGSCAKKLDSVVVDADACPCTNAVHPKPTTLNAQCSENDSSKDGLMMEKGLDPTEDVFRVDHGVEATQQVGEEVSIEGNDYRVFVGANAEGACCFPPNDVEASLDTVEGDFRNQIKKGNDDAENIESATVNHDDQLLERDVKELVFNQSPIKLQGDFDHSLEHNGHISCASFGYEESTSCFHPQGSRDGEIPGIGNSAVNLYDDFEDMMAANGTEFLNVDDDEVADDGTVDADDPQLLENSGWSLRTRAVAKYLQSLFEKQILTETQGTKLVVMDDLLAGKTRKEASRLFFESLVLKTRDYIHVEQRQPFDNINLMPRIKLMKSEF